MYRGMPSNDKDPRGYNAAQRQVLAWKKSPRAHVTTRPLRYPYDYPKRKPEEKGIDVHIAIDFAMMAVRGLRGACLARDRLSLSRAMLRGVNHPPEATETPIEIQLSTLRTTLGDDLVRDLEDFPPSVSSFRSWLVGHLSRRARTQFG